MKWEAAEKVSGRLPRIFDPVEEVIIGHNAVEEYPLAIQNLDAAARRLGLNEEEMLADSLPRRLPGRLPRRPARSRRHVTASRLSSNILFLHRELTVHARQ